MLRLQIREKQQQIKQLCTEVDDVRCMIKIIQAEKDQSSDEELNKHFDRAMKSEIPKGISISLDPDPKL